MPRAGPRPARAGVERPGAAHVVLGIMVPCADSLFVSRPSSKGGRLALLCLSASLLRSSRPVLVLPQKKHRAVGKRICIAWNQGAEAARARAEEILVTRTRTDGMLVHPHMEGWTAVGAARPCTPAAAVQA